MRSSEALAQLGYLPGLELMQVRINPIISRTFALSDVAEVHRHLVSGEAIGKLVLTAE